MLLVLSLLFWTVAAWPEDKITYSYVLDCSSNYDCMVDGIYLGPGRHFITRTDLLTKEILLNINTETEMGNKTRSIIQRKNAHEKNRIFSLETFRNEMLRLAQPLKEDGQKNAIKAYVHYFVQLKAQEKLESIEPQLVQEHFIAHKAQLAVKRIDLDEQEIDDLIDNAQEIGIKNTDYQ